MCKDSKDSMDSSTYYDSYDCIDHNHCGTNKHCSGHKVINACRFFFFGLTVKLDLLTLTIIAGASKKSWQQFFFTTPLPQKCPQKFRIDFSISYSEKMNCCQLNLDAQ